MRRTADCFGVARNDWGGVRRAPHGPRRWGSNCRYPAQPSSVTRHAENPTHKPRHCERSEAIHRAASREQRPLRLVATSLHGLPRFARNDGKGTLSASRLGKSHPRMRRPKSRFLHDGESICRKLALSHRQLFSHQPDGPMRSLARAPKKLPPGPCSMCSIL